MFESVSRSFDLVKVSFGVLRKDKEIMLFPIISGIVCILVSISFIIPLFVAEGFGVGETGYIWYIGLFLYYLVSYFIVIFFNTGLIACAHIRLKGGDPTFSDGIAAASKNIGKIFAWALISATVGLLLRVISERSGTLGRFIVSMVGMAWNLLTFFVIPVMIFENQSALESIKKSGSLFRKTWGENVVGQITMGLFFFILGAIGVIIGIILLILIGSIAFLPVLILVVLYLLAIAIVSASIDGIFKTALYIYAKEGKPPSVYSEDTIKNAFRRKT
ncbi:MAG: hypothetical protein A7315_06460 [Candidatus Altiarchaeales archaeon WOR_SM1_79]|nr:MAG: hypothetical protein A7315_06460 [Candidatus Altiarchaeales archaeon WOR_SM1_79]